MNSIYLLHFLFFSVIRCAIHSEKTSTSTGHGMGRKREARTACDTQWKVKSGFVTKDAIYIFADDNSTGVTIGTLAKLEPIKNGKWFRMYDGYPKVGVQWKSEFPEFQGAITSTVPDAALLLDNKLFLFKAILNIVITHINVDSKQSAVINTPKECIYYDLKNGTFSHVGSYDDWSKADGFKIKPHYALDEFERVISFAEMNIGNDHYVMMMAKERTNSFHSMWYHYDSTEWKLYSNITYRGEGIKINEEIMFHNGKAAFGFEFDGGISKPIGYWRKPDGKLVRIPKITTKELDRLLGENAIDPGFALRFSDKMWFGCPKDCNRFFFDGVTFVNNKLLIFAGQYVMESSSMALPLSKEELIKTYFDPLKGTSIPNFIDAVFTYDTKENTICILKGENIYFAKFEGSQWSDMEGGKVSDIFPEINNTVDVDGTILLDRRNRHYVYIFTFEPKGGESVHEYDITERRQQKTIRADLRGVKWVTDIDSNLPSRIDAVFKEPTTNSIYIVKTNYFWKINESQFWNQKTDSTFIKSGKVFGCDLVAGSLNDGKPNVFNSSGYSTPVRIYRTTQLTTSTSPKVITLSSSPLPRTLKEGDLFTHSVTPQNWTVIIIGGAVVVIVLSGGLFCGVLLFLRTKRNRKFKLAKNVEKELRTREGKRLLAKRVFKKLQSDTKGSPRQEQRHTRSPRK